MLFVKFPCLLLVLRQCRVQLGANTALYIMYYHHQKSRAGRCNFLADNSANFRQSEARNCTGFVSFATSGQQCHCTKGWHL